MLKLVTFYARQGLSADLKYNDRLRRNSCGGKKEKSYWKHSKKHNVLKKKVKFYSHIYEVYTPVFTMYMSASSSEVCWVSCVCYFMSCCCCHTWVTRGKQVHEKQSENFLRVPLLFYLYISGQYGGYFPLHEGPGYIGANQRAPFTTGTVHLAGGPLLLDALPGAGETELVRGH